MNERSSEPLLIGPLPAINKPLDQTEEVEEINSYFILPKEPTPLNPPNRLNYTEEFITGSTPIRVGRFFDGPHPTK